MPRKATKPKDPNAPKRALYASHSMQIPLWHTIKNNTFCLGDRSSYFLFSNERRAVLQKKMPEKKLTELSKIISVEWKELDEAKKQKYAARAKKDKDKYDEELAAYKKTEDYEKFQQKLELWKAQQKEQETVDEDGVNVKKVSLPRKPKDPNMPKRSAVCLHFIVFEHFVLNLSRELFVFSLCCGVV